MAAESVEIPDDFSDVLNEDIACGMLQKKPEPLLVYVYGDSTGSAEDTMLLAPIGRS